MGGEAVVSEYLGVQRVSASGQVVQAIRDGISRGDLKVGDRLPNETELSRQLGVGRSSYREGMRILNAYGVVEIRQGEGTYITNKCAEQVFEFMGFFPTNSNIQPLIELRRILEIGSLQLAAHKIGPEGVAQLESLVNDMSEHNSTERNMHLDKSFHELLINATNNQLLIQVYSMLSKMQDNLMSQLMCHDDVFSDAKLSHQQILSSLRARDIPGTVSAMEQHLDKIAKYAEQYIPQRR